MAKNKAPEAVIEEFSSALRDWLGLGDWKIWMRPNDVPLGMGDSDGASETDGRYLRATIEYRRELSGCGERLLEVIIHEFLHVALAEIEHTERAVLERISSVRDRVWFQERLTDAHERTIERLVRAFLRHEYPLAPGVRARFEAITTPPKDEDIELGK